MSNTNTITTNYVDREYALLTTHKKIIDEIRASVNALYWTYCSEKNCFTAWKILRQRNTEIAELLSLQDEYIAMSKQYAGKYINQ